MEYKISVIVPVYKSENYIERCVRSLFEQTMDDGVEYIFVNDCTPDKSIEILHQVLALYPHRVHQVKIIHHETNKGISTVRNTGLLYASGNYIGWVDSDDWVDTTMFEKLYTVAEKNHSDIVWCDFYYSCIDYEVRQSQYCEENKTDYIKSLLVGTVHGALWCSITKKEIYIKHNINFPDGQNVMEDKLVMIKLLFFSKNIKYVPEAYYHYVKNNVNSLTMNWGKDITIQEAAIANLLAAIAFLNDTGLRFGLQKYMKYAKLIFKKDFLNSLELKSFHQWKDLFPEVNSYVLSCSNMTLRQKILGWSINHGCWFIAKIWICIKKIK
jgi:glycosyltransferase involved in cell wall biosynthesis